MSVEFDPVRVGQRRRRVEPAVIGVVVMAVAIATAVAKPWDPGVTTPQPLASVAAIISGASAAPTAPRTPRPTLTPRDWTDVAKAVSEHEAWGVTAVLLVRPGSSGNPVSPPALRYVERWTGETTDATGAAVATVIRDDDRSIAALGVSVPEGVQARAVRIWRLHQHDDLEWVHAARIDDLAAAGAPLLIRMPLVDGVSVTPWEAGRYRMDVLTTAGIHRISVLIPNRYGYVPPPGEWVVSAGNVIDAAASDPSAIRIGLFATVDGTAVPIPARVSQPLEEAQAWRDMAGAEGSSVAAVWLPRATGLGVMMTAHASVGSATIRRLAPQRLADPPEAFGGISDTQGHTPFVVFPAPDGRLWPPGVYAITIEWEDPGGSHHGTWHVELRPGTL